MLFRNNLQVCIEEPSNQDTITSGIPVSGWCSSPKKLISLTGSINSNPSLHGIVDTFRPDLKSTSKQKKTGFSIFFPVTDNNVEMELVFEFDDKSRETYQRSFKFIVKGIIDREVFPYEKTFHNAGVEGRVLHRENIYGYGPPSEHAGQEIIDMILHSSGESLLDVGCGIGAYVEALSKEGKLAKGIEVNDSHVKRGQELNRDIMHYDGKKIQFDDNSFDTVYAIEVLEHVEHWESLLREMLRVARKNVFFTVPNIGVIPAMSRHGVVPWHLLESTHVNFFTRDILAGCLSRIDGITFAVTKHSPLVINNETFHTNLRVVIKV